ncbi:MAG: hypothetical protein GY765_17450 [bacterium]|nr:hypothetical protein [bacterium]
MEIRGLTLKSIPKFIRKRFGKKGLENWLDVISAEAYTVYGGTIDVEDWYPLKTMLIEPMANMAQLFFQWNLKEACLESGRYSADFGSKGMFRSVMLKVSTPEIFLEKAGEVFHEYYRPSEMKLGEYTDGMACLRITKFPEMDKTIEYRMCGWGERALSIAGCKDAQVELTKSLTSFDPYTEFKFTWTPKK